jgi:hypothetical protein
MALLQYTYDFLTLSGSIVAANLGQNFADIASVLNGGIRAENIAADAAIRSNQIADRFSQHEVNVELLPSVADNLIDFSTIGTGLAGYTISVTTAFPWKTRRIKAPPGKQTFLCGLSLHVQEVTTQEFEVTVFRNGTQIVGAVFIVAPGTDQYIEQENGSLGTMFDSPFGAFVYGDEIEYRIRAVVSGAVVRDAVMTEHWKSEHVS